MKRGRFRLRFRSKLILAMSLVVAASGISTLLITRHRVEKSYRRLFADQFRSQVEYYASRQQARLEKLAEMCDAAAENSTVVSALLKGDLQRSYAAVQQEMLRQLRQLEQDAVKVPDLRLPERPPPPLPPALPPARRLQDNSRDWGRRWQIDRPVVLLLDNKGRLVGARDAETPGRGRKTLRQMSEEQLRSLAAARKTGRLGRQQIGYAVLSEAESGVPQIGEFVVTPIRASRTDDSLPLGAVVVAVAFVNQEEVAMSALSSGSEFSRLENGLWIAGKLYSESIPESDARWLEKRLATETGGDPNVEGQFDCSLGGVPHRVIFSELNPNSPFGVACQVSVFSLAEAQREENEIGGWIAAAAAFSLAGSLLIILLLSRGLTGPIHDLVRGTNEIRDGNFDVQVPVITRDEIGELGESFNEMAKGLSLNRKYVTVLAQVTDKAVAQALMRGEVTLGGEVREVSVLFCDIRGFTALTEGMPPGEVIALLNEHMTAMTTVVHQNHGVVDKFVGDMIMAVFGAPASYGDDAQNAARCALEMIAERRRLNASAQHSLSVGIGLATGPAVAGCMGSVNRLNYTVLGERVNLASRLCSAASQMEVLIDESTKDRLPETAQTRQLPGLNLKGFTETVRAWKLDSMHTAQAASTPDLALADQSSHE